MGVTDHILSDNYKPLKSLLEMYIVFLLIHLASYFSFYVCLILFLQAYLAHFE